MARRPPNPNPTTYGLRPPDDAPAAPAPPPPKPAAYDLAPVTRAVAEAIKSAAERPAYKLQPEQPRQTTFGLQPAPAATYGVQPGRSPTYGVRPPGEAPAPTPYPVLPRTQGYGMQAARSAVAAGVAAQRRVTTFAMRPAGEEAPVPLAAPQKAMPAGYGVHPAEQQPEAVPVAARWTEADEAAQKFRDALVEASRELERQEDSLSHIRAELDPEVIRQRVALTLKEQEARKQLSEATAKETARQQHGGGVAGFLNRAVSGAQGQKGTGAAGLVGSVVGGAVKGAGEGGIAGAFSGAMGGVTAALSRAGPYGAAAAAGIDAATGMLGRFKDAVIELGGAASPNALRLFDEAVADSQATLGRVFVPVLELFTDAVRLAGDTLTSVLPSTDSVREALAPVRDIFEELGGVLAEVAPLIKDLISEGLHLLGAELRIVADAFRYVIDVLKKSGLIKGGAKLDSSVGAAGRATSFGTTDALAHSVYAAAASSGNMKEKRDPAEESANYLQQLLESFTKFVGDMLAVAQEIDDRVSKLAGLGPDFLDGFTSLPRRLADALKFW